MEPLGEIEFILCVAPHHPLAQAAEPLDPCLLAQHRIIAVADVFQALAQERPYRGPLAPEAILDNLKQQVEGGKLDGEVVSVVEANLQECWVAALGPTKDGPGC